MENSGNFEDDFLKSLQSSSEEKLSKDSSKESSVEGPLDFSESSSVSETPSSSLQENRGEDFFQLLEQGSETTEPDSEATDIFSFAPENATSDTVEETAKETVENDFFTFMNNGSQEEKPEAVDLFSLSEKEEMEAESEEDDVELAPEEAEEPEEETVAKETVENDFFTFMNNGSQEEKPEAVDLFSLSEKEEMEAESEEGDVELESEVAEESEKDATEEELEEVPENDSETNPAWMLGMVPPSEPPQKESSFQVEDKRVRCPGCEQEFYLSELIDVETGEYLDLAALVPAAETTSSEEETYTLSSSGPFEAASFTSDSVAGGTSAQPTRRVTSPRKKKKSLAKEIFYVVLGGLLAVPIAHYLAIPIQTYIQKVDKRGLLDIPTPFVPSTYGKVKDYPWIPRWALPGFDPEIHESAGAEIKASVSPSKSKESPKSRTEDATDLPMDEEEWDDDFSDSTPLETSSDGEDDFALQGNFTEVETPEEENNAGLSDLFGVRSEDTPVTTPATLPEEIPLGEAPDLNEVSSLDIENTETEEKPAETLDVVKTEEVVEVADQPLQTLHPPVYTVGDLEKMMETFLGQFSPEGMESICQTAKVLTFLSQDGTAEILQPAATVLKTLAATEEQRRMLNTAMFPLVTAENHGRGIVLVGTIEEPKKVRGLTAISLKLDGMEKKLYVIHSEAGTFETGKRYLFTGVVIDPNQDDNAIVTAKKSPVIWRGISWQLD